MNNRPTREQALALLLSQRQSCRCDSSYGCDGCQIELLKAELEALPRLFRREYAETLEECLLVIDDVASRGSYLEQVAAALKNDDVSLPVYTTFQVCIRARVLRDKIRKTMSDMGENRG